LLGWGMWVEGRQCTLLHTMLAEVGYVLDAKEAPELYVAANPFPNAITIGMDKAFIVISSGLVDLLDDEELRFVLGHEMGHVLSGHAVYQTMLQRLIRLSAVLTAIPLGGLGVRAIMAALMEWSRKAELSADRAGLLATQDPAVAFRVQMKTASGGHLEDLDPTSFFAQGAEYDASGDLRDSLMKIMLIEAQSHPFAVVRATQLRRWVDSGQYTAVLAGDYPRRAGDADAKLSDAAQEAARSYADAFRQSQDAVTKLVRDASGMFASVRDWMGGTFGGSSSPPPQDN
jgi:hypothetical protein